MQDKNSFVVWKFGGTSQLYSTYNMILQKLEQLKDKNIKVVIVLSAISGITNKLLDLVLHDKNNVFDIIEQNYLLATKCNVNIKEVSENFISECMHKKSLDDQISIVSKGEFFTATILNNFLQLNNIKSTFMSSLEVISSNQENINLYNKGEFTVESDKINKNFESYDVIVIPGFSGRTPNNKCCLLGRGGSDTTGSIIATAINASLYEIWTDVNGIYSSDPRKVSNTFINEIVHYDAAQEVAAMGAKVIHPYCILPCAQKSIPIQIKNTFNPEGLSTIICNKLNNTVYGVTIQDNVKIFKITSLNMWNNYGFVYDIFSIFKSYNVDVNIINTSQFNITTTTEESDLVKLDSIKQILENKYQVELNFNNSIVSIVGDNIRLIDNIGQIFKLTKDFNIITTSYSSNNMSLSFVIETKDSIKLAQLLHDTVYIK
jgi:diaminopimelate decarboxylase/aspartate kinase